MKALEFLKWMRDAKRVPWSVEGMHYPPSTSELARWIRNGSVSVDGVQLTPQSTVSLPVGEVVFFKGPRRTTMPGFSE